MVSIGLYSDSKTFNRFIYPLATLVSIIVICGLTISIIDDKFKSSEYNPSPTSTIKDDLDSDFISVNKRSSNNIQIIDFNIKNDAGGALEDGEEPWSTRKTGVIETLKERTNKYPTLIGLQEVIEHQLTDILDGLGSGWSYYGVPRANNGSDNELNPILYEKSQFNLKNKTTYWLSETPNTPSKSWGAKFNRIVTTTEFQHYQSNKIFHYLNTHLDAADVTARDNSATLILKIADNLGDDEAIILGGDFNSQQTDTVYSTITEQFTDSAKVSTNSKKREFDIDYDAVIDYIFYKKNDASNLKLVDYKVLNGTYDGYYISDHAPEYAVFEF